MSATLVKHHNGTLQVFKQTSIFTVSTAVANNEELLQHDPAAEVAPDWLNQAALSEEDEAWAGAAGFWSDDDDEDARRIGHGSRVRCG